MEDNELIKVADLLENANSGREKRQIKEIIIYAILFISFSIIAYIQSINLIKQTEKLIALQGQNQLLQKKYDSLNTVDPFFISNDDTVANKKWIRDRLGIIVHQEIRLQQDSSKIAALVNDKFYLQKELKKVINNFEMCNDFEIPKLESSINNLIRQLDTCRRNALNTYLFGTYYTYEIRGKSDTLDIDNLSIDLLFLKNISDTHLYLSIGEPNQLTIDKISYSPINPSNSFSRSDGQIAADQYVTISIQKLKSLKKNIVIEFTQPSTKQIPPFQTLKLIVNK